MFLAMEYMIRTGAFWIAKVDVNEMLAKENYFVILAVVFGTLTPDSLYAQIFCNGLCI